MADRHTFDRARLAVQPDLRAVQIGAAPGAQPFGHAQRPSIGRVDAADQPVHAQRRKGVVAQRRGGFGGIALPLGTGAEKIAKFRRGIAGFEADQDKAQNLPPVFWLYRQRPVPAQKPGATSGGEFGEGLFPVKRAAQMRAGGAAEDFGPGFEICQTRRAQAQAGGFQHRQMSAKCNRKLGGRAGHGHLMRRGHGCAPCGAGWR
jgi:hypothetical protein